MGRGGSPLEIEKVDSYGWVKYGMEGSSRERKGRGIQRRNRGWTAKIKFI